MKKVLVVLLVAVVACVGFVLTRPATFHVERSATIAAPAHVVFAQLEDFHRWPEWSPWEKLDPQLNRTFEGAASGVGASYHWVGNDKVGEGRMTITEAQSPQHLAIRLEFIKPWKSTNTTLFTLEPADGGTRVNWAMGGNHDFMGKAMSVFMNMDKLIGTDFEKGLANLNQVSEAAAASPSATQTPVADSTRAN